jgi:hypothetical protein
MLALVLRTTEFVFYHLLLSLVDRVSRRRATRPFPLSGRAQCHRATCVQATVLRLRTR